MKNRTIFQQLRCQISLENSENRQGSKGQSFEKAVFICYVPCFVFRFFATFPPFFLGRNFNRANFSWQYFNI